MGNPSRWKRIKVRFWTWLAWCLPRSLVYFTLVRVQAEVNRYDWSVLTEDEHVTPVAVNTVISQWHAICTWPKELLEGGGKE
jgi:hypothetical protein